jgi:hypothetical protein
MVYLELVDFQPKRRLAAPVAPAREQQTAEVAS